MPGNEQGSSKAPLQRSSKTPPEAGVRLPARGIVESMAFKSSRHPGLESRVMRLNTQRCVECDVTVFYWQTGRFHRGFGCVACNAHGYTRRDAVTEESS